MKVALGSFLTLDAAANPDFGQVEADPARVNLTAFETFFPERCPFFSEGSDLFSVRGPTYFYSRRIGVPNYDFRIRSFRSTGVFRWEWRRGSTLFLIWQRNLSRYDDRTGRTSTQALARSLVAPSVIPETTSS